MENKAQDENKRDPTNRYFTINPAMLDGSEWSVANLRKLCGDLGIKSTGSRSSLVRRLQRYHKENATQKFGAGAFAGIGVQLYSSPTKTTGPRVNKRFISPMIHRADGTPILKRQSCPTPRSAKRIVFSPYNQVQLVPNRLDRGGFAEEEEFDEDMF